MSANSMIPPVSPHAPAPASAPGMALVTSPFERLRTLLAGSAPGLEPIDMTIGEPRHAMPDFLAPILNKHAELYRRYPPSRGIGELRRAISEWTARRYPGLGGVLDPDTHILPLSGSREGLFSAIFPAFMRKAAARPAVLIPDPFYQAYAAAALAAGAEPVFLPATAATGFLPDLDALPGELLARTVAFYLASPANPQGAVADLRYLRRAIALARRWDFMLFVDECYSEIYADEPPPGALEAALASARKNGGADFDHIAVFNSLSKRSNVPGLRSGFIAGDAGFMSDFARFRNVACPQMPLPVQYASAALWADEDHVAANRALYAQKFALAEALLGPACGPVTPAGGFFLWLDMSALGGSEQAALRLWREQGIKVLPGAYLSAPQSTAGASYIRLALVDDLRLTETALRRIATYLKDRGTK